MPARHPDRTTKLLNAARQSPHFGVRVLAELPPVARAEAIRRWCLSNSPDADAPLRPGLKKCAAPALPSSGFSAQLEAFARSVGRVG